MSEMVDRVASAIEKEFESYRRVLDAGQAEGLARASIEAMREPTEAMQEAARVQHYDGEVWPNDLVVVWTTMADEALK